MELARLVRAGRRLALMEYLRMGCAVCGRPVSFISHWWLLSRRLQSPLMSPLVSTVIAVSSLN